MDGKKRHVSLIVGALLTAGLLAGAATAGNPHGTPPGQAKKAQSGSSTSSKGKSSTAPGHAKKSGSSSSSAGVKPSSTTQKNTHAAAGSNQTKLYGNGKTAGEIAQQNGASASTDLYGPGNSQPHKVAVCSKNGKTHYVDVHALKAHSSSSCTNATSPSGSSKGTSNGTSAGSVTVLTSPLAMHSGVLAAIRHSGVLAARHTDSKRVTGQAKAAHAVVRAASFTG